MNYGKMGLILLGLSIFTTTIAQSQSMDSLSYSLGILVAQNLKQQGFSEINANEMAQGISDVLKGESLKMDLAQANKTVQDYMNAAKAKKFGKAKEEGEAFLAANAKRKEVTVLPSGLQYEVLKEGDGPIPTASDRVEVHYHGMLIDGTVFDSSVERGQPATFGVTQVIKGWIEALQLMPVGSKWKLFIPYDLAYGAQGAGGKIGPYATLIFEVELLDIK